MTAEYVRVGHASLEVGQVVREYGADLELLTVGRGDCTHGRASCPPGSAWRGTARAVGRQDIARVGRRTLDLSRCLVWESQNPDTRALRRV